MRELSFEEDPDCMYYPYSSDVIGLKAIQEQLDKLILSNKVNTIEVKFPNYEKYAKILEISLVDKAKKVERAYVGINSSDANIIFIKTGCKSIAELLLYFLES